MPLLVGLLWGLMLLMGCVVEGTLTTNCSIESSYDSSFLNAYYNGMHYPSTFSGIIMPLNFKPVSKPFP